MPRGGHSRSGPLPQEGSARSDRRGYTLTALPSQGFDGPIPEWPLSPGASRVEVQYWERAWRTPQACAWSMPSESWRIPTVARWVRLSVRCDEPDAGAAHLAQLHRFADQIGMTTAGLAEMGWKVSVDELAAKAATAKPEPAKPSSRQRFKIAANGDA